LRKYSYWIKWIINCNINSWLLRRWSLLTRPSALRNIAFHEWTALIYIHKITITCKYAYNVDSIWRHFITIPRLSQFSGAYHRIQNTYTHTYIYAYTCKYIRAAIPYRSNNLQLIPVGQIYISDIHAYHFL